MAPESRRRLPSLILIQILSVFVYCREKKGAFDIGASEAILIVGSGNRPAAIKVRSRREYSGEMGHITGSMFMPYEVFGISLSVLSDYKDLVIIAVCKKGIKPKKVALELSGDNFKKAYDLCAGGKIVRRFLPLTTNIINDIYG